MSQESDIIDPVINNPVIDDFGRFKYADVPFGAAARRSGPHWVQTDGFEEYVFSNRTAGPGVSRRQDNRVIIDQAGLVFLMRIGLGTRLEIEVL